MQRLTGRLALWMMEMWLQTSTLNYVEMVLIHRTLSVFLQDAKYKGIDTRVTNYAPHSVGHILQHGVILDKSTLTFNGIGHIIKGRNSQMPNKKAVYSCFQKADVRCEPNSINWWKWSNGWTCSKRGRSRWWTIILLNKPWNLWSRGKTPCNSWILRSRDSFNSFKPLQKNL